MTTINTLRTLAAAKAEDGHLSAADAKDLVKAAGSGATAAKNLEKVLDQFGGSFTKAGRAEMLKAIGGGAKVESGPSKPADKVKISESTQRALLKTLNAERSHLGRPLPSMPLGVRTVEVPLFSEKHPDGYHFSAMIPVGALAPRAKVSDPNKATSCYIKRSGGKTGQAQFFGPFDIKRPGVEPPTVTTKYAVGEESGGGVEPPTVTTKYAVGEESGGGVEPPTVTTKYAVGEESGGGVAPPSVTTFYGIGEESGGPV